MALTTLDEVKQFYGIVGTEPDTDDLLESIIGWVSSLFDTHCNRTFDEANYTEYFNGGVDRIPVTNYPITTVSGVWDDRDWAWASSTAVSGTYYRIANNKREVLFRDVGLGAYEDNVKITYVAGYTTANLPGDLRLVCIEEVVRRYKRRQEVDVAGRTMDDGSSTLLTGDVLPQTKSVLDRYVRRRVI